MKAVTTQEIARQVWACAHFCTFDKAALIVALRVNRSIADCKYAARQYPRYRTQAL